MLLAEYLYRHYFAQHMYKLARKPQELRLGTTFRDLSPEPRLSSVAAVAGQLKNLQVDTGDRRNMCTIISSQQVHRSDATANNRVGVQRSVYIRFKLTCTAWSHPTGNPTEGHLRRQPTCTGPKFLEFDSACLTISPTTTGSGRILSQSP